MSKFADYRKKLGLSQREIAIAVGITDQTISNWEKGVYTPRLSPQQFKALADKMGVSMNELVELMT